MSDLLVMPSSEGIKHDFDKLCYDKLNPKFIAELAKLVTENDYATAMPWALIPVEPLMSLGRRFEFGANKYGANNWRNLDNLKQRYFRALLRHVYQYLEGKHIDEDGLTHTSGILWNAWIVDYVENYLDGRS